MEFAVDGTRPLPSSLLSCFNLLFFFSYLDSGDVMLASCDQEFYIRIWRISSRNPSEVKLISEEKKNSLEKLDPELEIKMTEETFALSDNGSHLILHIDVDDKELFI